MMPLLGTLPSVIRRFKIKGGLMVERPGTVDRTGAQPVVNPPTQFKVDPIFMVPAPDREMLSLPEGERDKEAYIFFSTCRVRTSEGGTNTGADVILYAPCGESEHRYRVRKSGNWKAIAGFWKGLAVKEEAE